MNILVTYKICMTNNYKTGNNDCFIKKIIISLDKNTEARFIIDIIKEKVKHKLHKSIAKFSGDLYQILAMEIIE